MSIYAVVLPTEYGQPDEALKEHFEDDQIKLWDRAFLVSSKKTTEDYRQEITDHVRHQPRTGDSSGFLHGDGGGGCSRMVESKADPMKRGSDTLTPGDKSIRGNGKDPANYGERIATLETNSPWQKSSRHSTVPASRRTALLSAHILPVCSLRSALSGGRRNGLGARGTFTTDC